MSIVFNKSAKTISLHTAHTTYQMKIMHHGQLAHTYYGLRCDDDMSYLIQYRDRGFSGNPYDAGRDRTISCDVLPLEYSSEGNGDYRRTAFGARDSRGVSGCDLRYVSHSISMTSAAIWWIPTSMPMRRSEFPAGVRDICAIWRWVAIRRVRALAAAP